MSRIAGLKGLLLILLFAATFAAVQWFKRVNYQEGYKARQTEELEAHAAALEVARLRERSMQAESDRAAAQRYKENADHEKTMQNLYARVRSGDERLRVTVAECLATPPHTGFTARPGDEKTAYLMPGLTERVLRAASDSARDVRDYNAIVDAYETMRTQCNDTQNNRPERPP